MAVGAAVRNVREQETTEPTMSGLLDSVVTLLVTTDRRK